MRNSLLQLRCEYLRLLKTCPTCLKAEPQYPPASSRLNGNRPWPRFIIEHLEEAISLLDGRHFLVRSFRKSLRAIKLGGQSCPHALPDRAASSEDFETQQRLITSVRFDVVTRGAEGTRFEFRHSSGSPLVQELTHEAERIHLVIMLSGRKREQLCLQVQ